MIDSQELGQMFERDRSRLPKQVDLDMDVVRDNDGKLEPLRVGTCLGADLELARAGCQEWYAMPPGWAKRNLYDEARHQNF